MHATATRPATRATIFYDMARSLRLLDADGAHRCLLTIERAGGHLDPGQVALDRGLLDRAGVERVQRVLAARARGAAVRYAATSMQLGLPYPVCILVGTTGSIGLGVMLLVGTAFLTTDWGSICHSSPRSDGAIAFGAGAFLVGLVAGLVTTFVMAPEVSRSRA
jgi:hypothetical protein